MYVGKKRGMILMSNKNEYDIKYQAEQQTLIGERQRRLVDVETGEQIDVNQITKIAYGQKNFWKFYLMDFLSVLGIFESRQLDVLVYVLENTNQSNNLFIGTYRKIEKDTGISYKTIANIMKKLVDNNLMKKVQNGVYLINPEIMVKGSEHKKQMLISYYREDDVSQNTNQIVGKLTTEKVKRTEISHTDFSRDELLKMLEQKEKEGEK